MPEEKSSGAAPKKQKNLPKQEQLPGVENAAIKEIEDAAIEYAEGRDERMEATRVEVERKQRLIEAMHKAKKTEYRRGNIDIKLVTEKESVKVKIKDEGEE